MVVDRIIDYSNKKLEERVRSNGKVGPLDYLLAYPEAVWVGLGQVRGSRQKDYARDRGLPDNFLTLVDTTVGTLAGAMFNGGAIQVAGNDYLEWYLLANVATGTLTNIGRLGYTLKTREPVMSFGLNGMVKAGVLELALFGYRRLSEEKQETVKEYYNAWNSSMSQMRVGVEMLKEDFKALYK